MPRFISRYIRLVTSLCTALALAACGGGGAASPDAGPDGKPSTLTLSAPVSTVEIGQTTRLSAVAKDQAGTTVSGLPAPEFVSGDPALAVVDPTGMVTAIAAGSVTITATVVAGADTLSATTTLTIVAPPASGGNTVSTPGTSFTPASITIAEGDSVTWEFSGATHNVTFLAAEPVGGSIADQSPGTQVSRTFTAPGTYDYECSRHSGMAGTVIVQAAGGQTFTSVELAPATLALAVGATGKLTATPRDQSGNALVGLPAAVLVSSDPAIATVNGSGAVTAIAAGAATITATITAGGVSHSATAAVTVTAPVPGGATVSTPNLTFSPANVTITAGATVTWQFSGSTHNVTFLGAAPAGGNIPDQRSGSTSRTFATAGTYDYECTRHSGMNGQVTVQGGGSGPFTSLAISPPSPTLTVGSTLQVAATPLDPSGLPLSGNPPASFTSSDPTRVTVSGTGQLSGVAPGTATITATLSWQGVTHSATATVTVDSTAGTVVTTNLDEFEPDDVEITPGESVTWQFSGATHNVTFEDFIPEGGSIGDSPPGTSATRTFLIPGDYDYECTNHKGMDGRIRVR